MRSEGAARPEAGLGIIVPTMNRPVFVERLLQYYVEVDFAGVICLADGSSGADAARVAAAAGAVGDRLRVECLAAPGQGVAACLKMAGEYLRTPYVAFAGDDDFLIPEGLREAIGVLEREPSVSAAHGYGIVVALEGGGPYGPVTGVRAYRQPVLTAASAGQRLVDHLTNYAVTLFSVHRRETWMAMFRDVLDVPDHAFANELLPCCLSAVYGQVHQLDTLGVVRQQHPQRLAIPTSLDWVAGSDWAASYGRFADILSREVARADGSAIDDARNLVRRAFWTYLTKLFRREWHAAFGGDLDGSSPLSRGGRRVFERLSVAARSMTPAKFSLDAMRRPTSPDYATFAPVFDAMTRGFVCRS